MSIDLDRLYTPEEVAERLKVSRRSVYVWLLSGQLAGLKAGHGWRIQERAIVDFMKVVNHSGKEVDGTRSCI